MQKIAIEKITLRLAEDGARPGAKIYRDGLNQLGVDCRDIPDGNGLRTLLTAVRKMKPTPRLAFDAAGTEEMHPKEPPRNRGGNCGYCGAKDGAEHATGCKTAADELDADAKALAQKMKKCLIEDETARRIVGEALGDNAPPLAGESAMSIYRKAFGKLHIPKSTYEGVGDADVLRELFLFALTNKHLLPNREILAADSANFAERFPNATRTIRIL